MQESKTQAAKKALSLNAAKNPCLKGPLDDITADLQISSKHLFRIRHHHREHEHQGLEISLKGRDEETK